MAYNKAQKHNNFQTEYKEHYIVDEQDFQGQQQLSSSQQSQGVQNYINQLIAEVRVYDKVAFTFGDQNSIFQQDISTPSVNQGQQILNQSQAQSSQKQTPAILTLEFEIPRNAIISNMVFASQQPAFSRKAFVQETKSTQRMLQISENESDEDKQLKIDAIGLSKKFRVQFLCMSYSILDVAIKFEKNESLDFSEEACNFLKVLFGGNISETINYYQEKIFQLILFNCFLFQIKNKITLTLADYQRKMMQSQFQSNSKHKIYFNFQMINLFKICFDSIKIYGYQLNVSPLASQCLSLLNISHILRKSGRVDDAIECEILLGLSMLSSRKYIQASEILKKCSQHFIQKYKQTNQSEFNLLFFQGKQHFLDNTPKMKKSNKEQIQKQKNEDIGQISGNNTSVQGSKRGIVGSSGNSYHSYSEQQCIAAKMELLVADSINHPSMIIEKLQAYQRATEYFTNQQYKEIDFQGSYDVYSGLLQLCPFLCKFLVKTLSDTFEPIKLAGIRGLEFLIEYLGCTLGNYLPQILLEIFKTYPSMNDLSTEQTQNQSFIDSQIGSENISSISGYNNQKQQKNTQDSNRNRSHAFIEGIGPQIQQEQKNYPSNSDQQNTLLKSQNLINFKIIIDMYHHLLESFLNVLASASSQILRVIFSDVIINNLFKQEVNPELKVYCIRVTEKILAICQGDIEIKSCLIQVSPQIINEVIILLEEMNTKPNVNVNLKFHVNKLWESIKLKYIYNMGSQQMNKLIEWIANNLIQLSENENFQNFSFLYHLLDITSVICYKQNGPGIQKKNNLINTSRSQKEIPFNSPFQDKSNPITPTNLQNGLSQQNNNQKTNSSQILTTQNYNQSQDYESHNVIMKFYFKLKNQQAALIVNQNELVNIEYLLKPLIIWVENSLQYQTKLELFRSIWQVLIEVLISLSNSANSQKQYPQNLERMQVQQIQNLQDNFNKNSDYTSIFLNNKTLKQLNCLTIADISLPLLQKINQHIQNQQPNEKMLQFLVIITNSLLQFPQESQTILFFFLQFFESYVQCIPHSIYDETFIIFDNLCDIVAPKNFTPHLIEQCINMLLDQYTVKGKAHRKSKDKFIQVILSTRQNLYEALQKLLFENQELLIITKKKNDTKLCSQMQELFSEKLSLVSELFSQLNKENFFVIEELIQSNKLQKLILDLINSRNSKSRLKGLNILKVLFEQYLEVYSYTIKPIQKLNRQDAYFIKLMLICLKRGLENERDSKLQFNALLILDQFFQHLFKGPNLQQEIKQSTIEKSNQIQNNQNLPNIVNADQIENLINLQNQNIEFDSDEYLQFRQKEILKLWPTISMLIDSPWSNIRSIAYGIICYWVKDSSGLGEKKFLSYLINTLQSLLTSKESECRTGGLNILGSVCGLGFNFDQLQNDFQDNKNFIEFFRRHSDLIPYSLWETVYDMQFDWDQTNQAASIILVQLCAPKDFVKNIVKNRQSGLTFKITSRASQQMMIQNNQHKMNETNLISMAQQWNIIKSKSQQTDVWQLNNKEYQIDDYLEDQYVFWISQLEKEDIMELISMFKNEFKPPQTLWIERVNYNMEESKQEEIDQNYSWIDEKQTFDGFKQFGLDKEEEILDLDDLGIIEVDDEEWNEYDVVDSDNTRRKIPNLKQKINNISPQLQIRDKSPSMRVVRKGKLQQQQNLISDTGADSFSQRTNSNNEKEMKQQQTKSPEKGNNQISRNSIIEEESGEDVSSQDEINHQTNDPYSVVEQYLQIDDGENVRIIDELELMQFLKQNNLALQKSNSNSSNNANNTSEEKSKKKQSILQQGSAKQFKMSNYKSQQSSSQNSFVSQVQSNSDKLRPNTPPILIEDLPQTYSEQNEDEFNSQKYTFNKLNSNQLQQLNNNRGHEHSSDQKSSIVSFSKNSFLPQQKSEEYIYSDSAESDDYQDMFIKQQEFLFRQQKQQKSQLNNNRDIPNRPLSAKLKKEEAIMTNNATTSSAQGLGGQHFYQNFEMLPQQSSSLPSIAQVAAGNNNQLSSQNQQINKNQLTKGVLPQQSASTKSLKQSIQNLKNNQLHDESSEDEQLNILKSRYSSSKQALTNNSDLSQQNDKKQQTQQVTIQDKNKQIKSEVNQPTSSKNNQQIRYFSPPRPQSGCLKKSDLKYINEQMYESNYNGAQESELLSSPFDQNTDIVNLDSPSPPYKNISLNQGQQVLQNSSNFMRYQQQQSENLKEKNDNKSNSENKSKSKENSNSMMASIGCYSNDSSEQKNNNNTSMNGNNHKSNNLIKQQVLQNNFIQNNEQNDQPHNRNSSYQDYEKINNSNSNNIQNSAHQNNSQNTNKINNQQQEQHKQVNYNQIQNNLSGQVKGNYLNEIIQNFGIPGQNSFDEQYQGKGQNLENKNELQNNIQNTEQLLQEAQSGQISERGLFQEQTNNSISAAQGSFSYLNISQFQTYQNPLTSVSQAQATQQIANSTSTNPNPNNKFISEKININRLVSVPSNYRAHFGTNSSLSGIYPNSNTFNVNYNQNSSNSNQIFNTTLNATLNQNQSIQQHNNTLVSHNSASNLFKNVALNNSNQQLTSHTLPVKPNGQIQSSRSKDRLLKKLMENNIDFNDLKSVWKMSSEIKNISQHHNHSHSSNQNHLLSQNTQNINYPSNQQYSHLQQNSSAAKQFAIHYNPHQNQQEIIFANKDNRAYESVQSFYNEQSQSQANTISKFQRSNSLGRNQLKTSTSTSNLLTPLQLPIQPNTKLKKDSRKKKIKKKIEKLTQNSSGKNHFQTNNALFMTTSQSQQNTARNHHQVQQYDKKGGNNGVHSERSMNIQDNQLAYKKNQLTAQVAQNNISINSPQRKSLQSSPSQEVGNFSVEKKSKRNSKTKILEKALNNLQQNLVQKQGNIQNQEEQQDL